MFELVDALHSFSQALDSAHLQWHEAGPGPEPLGEHWCEQTDPVWGHTMLASSVLSDSELLLLSSLGAKSWGGDME